MTPKDRQRYYLQHLLLDRDPAKELRVFHLAPYLRRRYDELYEHRIAELRGVARRRSLRSLVAALASAAVTAVAAGGLAWFYVSGRMSLAATGAAVFGLYQLSGRLRTMHFSAASLYESTLFLRDYTSFLVLARAADGSGKTTLAKLIAGLYPPAQGRVMWNGTEVNGVVDDVAVIFQDFERYMLTAGENIGVGRHELIEDAAAIAAAAERAGAQGFVGRLPPGYDTMLGREFVGGWDL